MQKEVTDPAVRKQIVKLSIVNMLLSISTIKGLNLVLITEDFLSISRVI